MGSCFSVEGGDGSERKEATDTSQVAPADAVEPAASVVRIRTDMAESAITGEAAHAELISNHEVAISDVMEEAAHADLISNQGPEEHVRCKMMTYDVLHAATEGFKEDLFLGEGGFGPVYKGFLGSTNQEVAIKILNLQENQGDKEFLTEVMILGKLHHPNLVKLLGCCADRGQRLLVYEYMPLGSLFNHIHDLPPGKQPLDWITRIKILLGTAKGLETCMSRLTLLSLTVM